MKDKDKDKSKDKDAAELMKDVEEKHRKPREPVTEPRGLRASDRGNVVDMQSAGRGRRRVPNIALRSALFSVVGTRFERPFLREVVMPAMPQYRVVYTGWQLDQADLDVWEVVLYLCRHGNDFGLVPEDFLRIIRQFEGRGPGKGDRKWLVASFGRLSTAVVLLEYGRQRMKNSLMGFHHGQDYDEWTIYINQGISDLLRSRDCSPVELERRLKLGRNQLSKWLHDFYSSHKEPYPMKVETLHRLCGSQTRELRKFRQLLKQALEQLKGIGFVTKYRIDKNDKVHVTHVLSKAPVYSLRPKED